MSNARVAVLVFVMGMIPAMNASAQAEPVPVVVSPTQANVVTPPGYQNTASERAPVPPQNVQTVPLEPARSGFTLELGMGVGYLSFSSINYSSAGLYGLNLGLGGFLSPDLALTFRATGVTTIEKGGTITFASGLGSLQYFATDRLTVGGGIGFMVGSVRTDKWSVSSKPGLGLNARVGYTLVDFGGSALRAALELNVGWIESDGVVNTGLGLEYQLF